MLATPTPMPETTTVFTGLTTPVIGAIFGLLTAVVVQAFIVPARQAHIRQRERWEDAVAELSSLLEVALPRLMRQFKSTSEFEQRLKALDGDPTFNQDKLKEFSQSESRKRMDVGQAIDEEMARISKLTARVVGLRKKSRESMRIELDKLSLQSNFILVTSLSLIEKPLDDKAWREAWGKFDKVHSRFTEEITALEQSMRPPKRGLFWRGKGAAKGFIRTLRSWISASGTWMRNRHEGARGEPTQGHEDSEELQDSAR